MNIREKVGSTFLSRSLMVVLGEGLGITLNFGVHDGWSGDFSLA